MPFPFSIRYNKPLRAIITADNQQQVLEYIKERILGKKANNIIIKGNQVSYKGSTGGPNSLFNIEDNGVFSLVCIDSEWRLICCINIRGLFLFSIIVAAIASVLKLWLGVTYFVFLYGVNVAISSARHGDLIDEIGDGIDELLGATVPPKEEDAPREDSEKLKSWF